MYIHMNECTCVFMCLLRCTAHECSSVQGYYSTYISLPHTHTYIHMIHTYAYRTYIINVCMYLRMNVCVYVFTYECMCVCTYQYTWACTYQYGYSTAQHSNVCMHVALHSYVCMHATLHSYVCMYVHIHIQGHVHINRCTAQPVNAVVSKARTQQVYITHTHTHTHTHTRTHAYHANIYISYIRHK